jgi:glyoxylase I family protein
VARALHHLALGTADVAALAAFYRDVLGLTERARHSDERGALRSVWLDLGAPDRSGAEADEFLGNPVLMIEYSASPARRVDGIGSGLFLIALRVSASERQSLERKLEARGHPIEARTEHSSYSRDPDGNRIAISHHPLG